MDVGRCWHLITIAVHGVAADKEVLQKQFLRCAKIICCLDVQMAVFLHLCFDSQLFFEQAVDVPLL